LPHRSPYIPTAGEIAMKSCNLIFVPLGALFALAANADVTAKTPRIAAAQNAAGVISHAQRAVTSFVAACASRDAVRLNSVTTDDVRIEYALEDPGSYLSVDAASLITACAAQADASSTGPRIANLWIFPTSDASTVFVQYDLTAGAEGPPHRQLALVELRGERIARMLNYSGAPPALLAGAARAVASTTTAARGAE
jgi:hypothetical protein